MGKYRSASVVKRDSRLSMASKTGILLVLLGLLAGTWAQTCEDFGVVDAPPCNADANCTASQGCACSGDEPDIPLEDRPMIVYLTFDDALTQLLHTEYFTQLFDGTYSNPNGCPIRATFFLTHESNDYTLVNKYYSEGHEMASHSITHLNDQNYWEGLDVEGWRSEITDMRSMIANFGQVAEEDIIGMRSPFLINGGDTMLSMMSEDGFTYDSTVASLEFGYFNLENGRWPYTYDYASTMDCQIPPCATCSFPGVWSQPILDLEDSRIPGFNETHGYPCAMLDSCVIEVEDENGDVQDETADMVYEMLKKNFERAYNGRTRAPLGFYTHAAWWASEELEHRFEGFKMWMDDMMNNYDDVWVVPIRAGIEYMMDPVAKDELDFYEPFGCADLPDFTCFSPRNCRYTDVEYPDFSAEEIYMASCVQCPPQYPWVGNPDGN